ncbi:glycoside hydrolase family 10 protein, partial [Limnofasciculus baicalensis]
MRQFFLGAIVGTLIDSLVLLSATSAQTVQLGVVKSPDNQGYWSGITARLNKTGVDYCIVDWTQVEQVSDFGSPQVLFLPNIEQLEPSQLLALQEWMRQGGATIVSGAVGVLSQPTIRNRLRSLLGAYWGFALTQSVNLEPLSTNTETWVSATGLASKIQGGVLIPVNVNSTTVAVWNQKENPPAVVTTDKSTFLGWRWGVDGVAGAEVDSAWLRATLFRYNITPTPREANTDKSVPYCSKNQSSRLSNNLQQPRTTNQNIAQNDPDAGVLPPQTSPNNLDKLTPEEISVMSQELADLIGRFESTLLTANAADSNVELLTHNFVEQLSRRSKKETITGITNNLLTTNNQQPTTNRIVTQARIGWQNFLNAVDRKDYTLAKQYWFDTRRLLWDNYPINSNLAQPEIRAIWLDRGTIVKAKSEQDLAKIFDKLAAAGFNTVFFETVNASYPIYPSRVAPEQNPLVRGWDPLASAVKLAHERGMELHAWVWIFAAANQRHNSILNQPDDYTGPLLTAHPDWVMFDRQGNIFDSYTKKAFLDPANPEVRSYLISLLEEIVNRYQVDGIQLDYIRYPFQNPKVDRIYGYSQIARQEFQKLTGVDPIAISPNNPELWQKWTDFRIRQIDSFVATVSAHLRQEKPDLIISAAVFAIPRGERLEKLQQNWEDWAIRGDIDLVVPMTYALDTAGLQTLAQPVLTQSSLSSALVVPGIRLLNLPDIVAVDQIQLLRDLPAAGYALFAAENLNPSLQD